MTMFGPDATELRHTVPMSSVAERTHGATAERTP